MGPILRPAAVLNKPRSRAAEQGSPGTDAECAGEARARGRPEPAVPNDIDRGQQQGENPPHVRQHLLRLPNRGLHPAGAGNAGDHMPRHATPLYARMLLGFVKPFPDFDFPFIKPVRASAVALLRVRPGARVLDVGCGSGGSFQYLRQAAGETGEVVGVEISASTADHAQRRIDQNRWTNVRVVVAPAQTVTLEGTFDALLMFAAPDVYASKDALDNLLPRLQNGARVVFFGAKTSTRPLGWLLNSALHFSLTKLSLPTTPGLELEPWRHIAPRLRELEIKEYFHGWMFLASGTLNTADAQ